jgi:hypothetical protein
MTSGFLAGLIRLLIGEFIIKSGVLSADTAKELLHIED